MRRYLSAILYLVAAVAVIVGVNLPMWSVQLYFPQYPEGPLRVVAHAGSVTGDLAEIDMLNEYIGVTFPHDIPELAILPGLLYGVAALAAVAALTRGKVGLWVRGGVIGTMVGTAGWMLWRINGYLTKFGANPDPDAPLAGLMKPFKPPLWGKATIVQVEAVAGFLAGSYLLALAGVLLGMGFWVALRNYRQSVKQI